MVILRGGEFCYFYGVPPADINSITSRISSTKATLIFDASIYADEILNLYARWTWKAYPALSGPWTKVQSFKVG